MAYREVRVRPVVRYIVTEFECDDKSAASHSLGIFENVEDANRVGTLLADSIPDAVFEPARKLRIGWTRAPGAPKDAIQWHVAETSATD